MTEFIEVKSKNAERAERVERGEQNGTRQPGVKRMCAFLVESGDSAKVGGMIKNDIPAIRKDAGGPCFISYKSEADAEPEALGEWLAKFPELALMESQGAGWYIWSFRAEVTMKVKGDLLAVSEKRDAKARAYERRFDRTAVLVTVDTPVRPRGPRVVPGASEFPATIGGVERGPRGVWAGGPKGSRPQESNGPKKGRVIRVEGPMDIRDVTHRMIPASGTPVVVEAAAASAPAAAPKKDAFDDDE